MQISERQLRLMIRETLEEAAATPGLGAGKTYSDDQGNQFRIMNGKLTLVKRGPRSPKGQAGLPIAIPQSSAAAAATNLLAVPANKGDAALMGLAGQAQTAAGAGGLTLGPNIGGAYPVTVDQLKGKNDFIHPTPAGVDDCSAWARRFVGWQGNAWFASKNGTLKYNAFANVGSYKAQAEALFKQMNAVPGLNVGATAPFNAKAKAITDSMKPSPASLKGNMQIGDVVGMYFAGSTHHAEAFFESCSGWDLTHNKQMTPTSVNSSDGSPWDVSMIGQNKSFTVTGPFAPNTHLGFVGGMLNGEPLIFHNIHGKVHVNRLSAITSIGAWPVWVKAGVSSSILPSSLNPTGAWQQLKSTVLGLF